MELTEKKYWVNNISLQVREGGRPDGKVMLFLHGFPEGGYAWRKQIPYFIERGYRVVVPDQRGYNQSSKPEGIKAYSMPNLVKDVAELIGQLRQQKVVLIGHDWGGAVAWVVAIQHPHLLDKLVVLNLPHPEVMKKTLKRWPPQLLRSWYMGFFQVPVLPELACSAADFALLEEGMHRSALPGTFSDEEMKQYKEAWRQPGTVRAMLNWYRAIRHRSPFPPGRIHLPALLLWGKKDLFLSHRMAQPSIEKCRNGKLVMLAEASHWLQHEVPKKVNSLIEDFIR